MKNVLVVGEKTSQVKKFAETLCGSYKPTKLAKYIYSYQGIWYKSSKEIFNITFFPLSGHITYLDTPKGFGWNECKPIEVIQNLNSLKVYNKRPYVSLLNKTLDGNEELWLATDPDAEGDNIAYEVMGILKKNLTKNKITVRRIWNSSLTNKDIQASFANPREWVENLALAIQVRRIIDALLGFAGTRELTQAARRRANVKVISIGRVQLPTLNLIVQRDFEHETFKSKQLWGLAAIVLDGANSVKFTHILGNIHEREKIVDIQSKLAEVSTGVITSVTKNEKKVKPPEPMNTNSALVLLSKVLKKTAKQAMEIIERLYELELISYPRTENTKFSEEFPHHEILNNLSNIQILQQKVTQIKNPIVRNNGRKRDKEDHDPIHPTGSLKNIIKLNDMELGAWKIITFYYLSLFFPDSSSLNYALVLDIQGEKFTANFRKVLALGWRELHFWSSVKAGIEVSFQEKEEVRIKEIIVTETKTEPPKRLTDGQLLLKMEKQNIGTKSSRAEIINLLVQRGYVKREKSQIKSELLGRALIVSLTSIWDEILSGGFTSVVEEQANEIIAQNSSFNEILAKLRQKCVENHMKLINRIDFFVESFSLAKYPEVNEDKLWKLLARASGR